MKIVCDNCATKYSIADDKVRGKVFKIRCKKCNHIIVVRGQGDSSAADSSGPAPLPAAPAGPQAHKAFGEKDYASAETGAASANGADAAAHGDAAVWHLVIDREQIGPMTVDEVRARAARGEIDGETYAWREGFADWQKLIAISEFADLMSSPQVAASAPVAAGLFGGAPRGEAGDLFAAAQAPDEASEEGLFASAPATTLDTRSPFAHAQAHAHAHAHARSESPALFGGPAADAGLFAAPAPNVDADGGLFAAAAVHDSSGGRGAEVRPQLTAQRNENSVLFSLSNLQALAMSGKDGGGAAASTAASPARTGYASSQTEGSGLIDIRAMAQSTLGASAPMAGAGVAADDDLPAFGASFSPVAAPVLLPMAQQTGMPKWMWGIIVGGVVLVGILAVMVFKLMNAKPIVAAQPIPVAPAPAALPPAVGTPPVASAASPDKKSAPAAVAAEDDKKADDKAADDKKSHRVASSRPHHGSRSGAPGAPGESPPPSLGRSDQPVAPSRSTRKAGGDELDALLNKAIGNSSVGAPPSQRAEAPPPPRPSHQAADDAGLPDSLGRSDIQRAMSAVKPHVNACYSQFNVPGIVNVSVTISPSGRVSAASAKDKFAGTPTGDCVARAVRSASFPRFKQATGQTTIDYPFLLSK